MADLTTDQRLSTMLLPVLSELQDYGVAANRNAEAFRANGKVNAAQAHVVLEQRADEQVERLADLIEGLAAGSVRIVDEAALRVEIGALVETVRLEPKRDGEPTSPILIAHEMVADLKDREVLR